jgi:hypothetical protein
MAGNMEKSRFRKCLTGSLGGVLCFLLVAGNAQPKGAAAQDQASTVQFDAILELNAPTLATHIVLFARYWVAPDFYCMAVVWGEPHAGGLNFPTYPPTLNVISDPQRFAISHQFHSLYDRAFAKPVGSRGPFRDKMNSYDLSAIRFAEKDARDLQDLAREKTSTNERHLDELSLYAENGGLVESIQYEYAGEQKDSPLLKQQALLPERPITVGFSDRGPTITVGGQKQQYSELETVHHKSGRRCVVDYAQQTIGGHSVSLPARIAVYSGDGERLLRSARLCNVTTCELTTDEVRQAAEQFSLFDPNDLKCRELLLKYWLKSRSEVAADDVATLEQLRRHFARESSGGVSVGEQLKRVNTLLQLDWMLDDPNRLEEDFRQYTRLLRSNGLGRMVLFGGENVIETTTRWGQIDAADRLLAIWRDAGASDNDARSILDFASANMAKESYWTTAKLLEKSLASQDWGERRLAGQVLRCAALARLHEGFVKPEEFLKTEQAKAQAGWVATCFGIENVTQALRDALGEARQTFANVAQPTKQQTALEGQLEAIEKTLADSEPYFNSTDQ